VLGDGSGSLTREMARALEDGATRVLVDLAGVTFLDAAGIGELVACRALADRAGARFKLCGAAGKARQLLRITGLDRKLMREPRPLSLARLSFRVA